MEVIPSHCISTGVSHGKLGGHHYFLSWREPWHKFEDWDWFNGRNFCRERCMDLVSFETPLEFKMFEEVMQQGECVTKLLTEGLRWVSLFSCFCLLCGSRARWR